MSLLSRPRPASVTADHDPVCIGDLTIISLKLVGCARFHVSSKLHPQWKGVSQWYGPQDENLSFPAPTGAPLRIRCIGPFGWSITHFTVPLRNTSFAKVPRPGVELRLPELPSSLQLTGLARHMLESACLPLRAILQINGREPRLPPLPRSLISSRMASFQKLAGVQQCPIIPDFRLPAFLPRLPNHFKRKARNP